jgi:hypothetical protein
MPSPLPPNGRPSIGRPVDHDTSFDGASSSTAQLIPVWRVDPCLGGRHPAYGPPGGWGCLCGTHQAVSRPQNSMPRSRQPTHARPAPPPEPMHPPQTSSGSIVWAWGVGRAGAGREGRRVRACMHGVGWGEKASCSPSLSRKNRRTRSRPRRQMVGGPPPSAPRSPHQGRPPWPCLAPGRG